LVLSIYIAENTTVTMIMTTVFFARKFLGGLAASFTAGSRLSLSFRGQPSARYLSRPAG